MRGRREGGGGVRGAINYPVGLPGIPDRKLREVKTSQYERPS